MRHPLIHMPIGLYQVENDWYLSEMKKFINISENQYTINITYPEYFLRGQPLNKFNIDIYTKINNYAEDFKNSATIPGLPIGPKSNLNGEYTTYTAMQRFITAKSDLYPYLRGAHPGHDMITTTFDTNTNSIIVLSDLFKARSSYLERLSNLSEKALFEKYPDLAFAFNDPTYRKGFAPRKENFSHWALTDDSLIIFFPEYQVSPYAAGTLDIQIPYESVKEILTFPDINI